MKKSIKTIGAMTLALVMAATTVPVQNVKAATDVGSYELSDTSVNGRYDITGDGVADTVKFEKTENNDGSYYCALDVRINGNVALNVKNVDYDYIEPVLIQTKEHAYIFITTYHGNDYLTLSKVYEYVDGKLKQRLDLDSVVGKIFYQYSPNVYDVKDEYIELSFAGQSNMLAKTSLRYRFQISSTGTLSVANKITSVSYSNKRENAGKIYTSKYLVASKKLQAYCSSTGTKKAFTITKGTKLKISHVAISGKTPRFYCATSSGKKGWVVSKQNLFKDLSYAG